MNIQPRFWLLPLMLLGTACDGGPKVITADSTAQESPAGGNSGIFMPSMSAGQATTSASVHQVKVLETLPTERYVYLRVSEGEEEFWIATRKQEVKVGETYFYRDGLLKTNFESKEYKRTFDRIFLVSNLVTESHGLAAGQPAQQPTGSASPAPATSAGSTAMRVADLVRNADKLQGQKVILRGVCTKVNANIMGRNWIHLQDGSKDDYDLVVTTLEPVAVGEQIQIEAVVALNKDFGSGYRYALLLEEGHLMK